jgi:hypothetical protein
VRTALIPILLVVSACSDGSGRASEAAPTHNGAGSTPAAVYTGVLSVGFHGPVFSTDEEIDAAIAEAKGGLWETVGMLIETEGAARTEFRGALDRAISKGVAAGIPEKHMRMRVKLEGAPELLPVVSDGYTHQFRLSRIVSIEPCPRKPASKQGCSNGL